MLRRSVLADMLRPAPRYVDEDGLEDYDAEDWDDVEAAPRDVPGSVPSRELLLGSPLLLSSLEHSADSILRDRHLLATLYRCQRPNPYLYEESLKGRVLTAVERGWVDEYLRLEPQFRKYEAHLKQAALGGVRAAALEYGAVFEGPTSSRWRSG